MGQAVVYLLAGAVCALAELGWADEGDEVHWAFVPVPEEVPVPGAGEGWARNAIDRFVWAGLEERGLRPNAEAEGAVLLRRLWFGLVGLPPSPEKVGRFAGGASEGEWGALVEELLGSRAYGERWGRHWLDVARYADTTGDGADAPIPEAALYRDYVIDSFWHDLPYDEFLKEQLAGDLMVAAASGERERERLVATGYVALSRRFNNGEYRDMHLVIDNTLGTVGRGVMGLTMDCVRCHDHRDDPIAMGEYYGMFGFFSSTQYPHGGTEIGRKRKNFVSLPGGGIAYSVRDKGTAGEIGDAPVLLAGDPNAAGETVSRGVLAAFGGEMAEIPDGQSGRLQLAEWLVGDEHPLTARVMVNRIWGWHFGRGIVASSNNFGRGGEVPSHPELLDWLAREFIDSGWSVKHVQRLIVGSASYRMSSVGREDGLAVDPDNRWLWRMSRQRLEAEPIRDAVLAVSGGLLEGAPEESPLPKPNANDEYPFTQHRPFLEDFTSDHRAVYLPTRRLGRSAFLGLFDGPDTNQCSEGRRVSTVATQALYWLNNGFVERNALALAERLLEEEGAGDGEKLERAFLLAYGRVPAEDERDRWLGQLERMRGLWSGVGGGEGGVELAAWKSIGRVLLASSEFLYVD